MTTKIRFPLAAVGAATLLSLAAAFGAAATQTADADTPPIHVPVNVCENSSTDVGELNPAFGNLCTQE
ncbi:MAG: chaplin [Nocardioides sp.]